MSAIQAIHASARSIGLDEDGLRDVYERATGKRRLTLMSGSEQYEVLKALRASGAKVQSKGRQQLTGPYAKKLQALWLSGWNLGVVQNRDDKAMLAFIKRQTGIENTRFLRDASDARKAVEALKSWLHREAGVSWLAYDDPQDAVISAQANILDLKPGDDFSLTINGAQTEGVVGMAKLAIMQRLGERIRGICTSPHSDADEAL